MLLLLLLSLGTGRAAWQNNGKRLHQGGPSRYGGPLDHDVWSRAIWQSFTTHRFSVDSVLNQDVELSNLRPTIVNDKP